MLTNCKVPRLGWGFSHPGLIQMLRLQAASQKIVKHVITFCRSLPLGREGQTTESTGPADYKFISKLHPTTSKLSWIHLNLHGDGAQFGVKNKNMVACSPWSILRCGRASLVTSIITYLPSLDHKGILSHIV